MLLFQWDDIPVPVVTLVSGSITDHFLFGDGRRWCNATGVTPWRVTLLFRLGLEATSASRITRTVLQPVAKRGQMAINWGILHT